MSATGIVFLALSVVMLGLGFYGASVDVVSATGLAESIGQMKNFYFLLGGLILFIVLYRLAFSKASLRVQHTMSTTIRYVILIGVGVFMVYPLLWMISATFKDNNEIFSTLSLIPTRPTMDGYKAAMNNYGGDINIWQAMLNTYKYVIPKVIFTVVSSTITAYGFGRFRFRGRNFLFAVLMATLFLPQVVLNIPQFLMYRQFGWVDSPYYLALIVPTLFAQETYFVYMLIQFMRNIPRELDEAAKIDGCNIMQTLVLVLVPMLWPAMVSAGLFQFMWSSNDFMGPLLYVNSPARYPATLFVRMSMDADTGFAWNRVMAVSLISIIPSLVVFFLAQRQFMDGVTAGAVKG